MADESKEETVSIEDVMAVRSRISWGAILAGSVVAVATLLVLGVLGGAIGLSATNDVDNDTLATGAALWALICTIVAMFLAGWITSQCAVGENKREAVIHGVIAWGVVLGMCFWLAAGGIGAGLDAVTGIARTGAELSDNADWEAAARRAGVSQDQINQMRQTAENAPNQAAQAVQDPANREAVRETASSVTWWTFVGMILSLASSIAGALLGAGPTFALVPVSGQVGYTVREGRYSAVR